MRCGLLVGLAPAVAAAFCSIQVQAQAYPTKPIRVIMAVQGGAEVTVRIMANKVTESMGQPLVIEMMPGAGGEHRRGRRQE